MNENIKNYKRTSNQLAQEMRGILGPQYESLLDKMQRTVKNDNPHSAPPKNFEKIAGISGIYENYVMPAGISIEEMESIVEPCWHYHNILKISAKMLDGEIEENLYDLADKFQVFAKSIYENIVALNPKLAPFRNSGGISFRFHLDVISGACSCFPTEDIKFYLERINSKSGRVQLNAQHIKLRDSLEKFLGNKQSKISIGGWYPSESTLDKINQKLQIITQTIRNTQARP
jgi:hypothetical protein